MLEKNYSPSNPIYLLFCFVTIKYISYLRISISFFFINYYVSLGRPVNKGAAKLIEQLGIVF